MPQIALKDLSPRWSDVLKDWSPATGGTPTGRYQLIFLCPVCRTHEVSAYLGAEHVLSPATWKVTPYPPIPNWIDIMSVEPSINNQHNSYRKKGQCGFHGNIVNGQVIYD